MMSFLTQSLPVDTFKFITRIIILIPVMSLPLHTLAPSGGIEMERWTTIGSIEIFS